MLTDLLVAIAIRKQIRNNQIIEDLRGKQIIAIEERELDRIEAGSPDLSELTTKITELEEQLEAKERQISKLQNSEEQDAPSNPSSVDSKPKTTSKKVSTRKTTTKADAPKQEQNKGSEKEHPLKSVPSLKDIVIRDLAKTEREWILVYAFLSSNSGQDHFTREDILEMYDKSNRRKTSRIANLSNNLKYLIKSDQLKYLNDNDLLLTSEGIKVTKEILNR